MASTSSAFAEVEPSGFTIAMSSAITRLAASASPFFTASAHTRSSLITSASMAAVSIFRGGRGVSARFVGGATALLHPAWTITKKKINNATASSFLVSKIWDLLLLTKDGHSSSACQRLTSEFPGIILTAHGPVGRTFTDARRSHSYPLFVVTTFYSWKGVNP